MSDNATTVADANATLPAGTVISTEEVTTLNGGAVTAQHVQRLLHSYRVADSSVNDVSSANPLPVAGAVTISGGATAANQATANAALAAIETALASLSTESTLGDVLAAIDAVFGAVDGLEGKDFATQTTLAAAKTVLDNILTKLQASIAVTGTFWQATQPVSGTVTANAGTNLNTSALALESGGNLDDLVTLITAQALMLDGLETLLGDIKTLIDGLAAAGETQPVSLASVPSHAVTNAGTFAVQETGAVSTDTHSNVASSATNVTLLSSNSSRKAATIYNDSTQILYVKFGATASATSFKVKMAAGSYYEFPKPIYTGQVDGIWASANGSARITES